MIKDGKFYKKKEGMKRMSKKILVTGCNGQLGRAINKEYAGSDIKVMIPQDMILSIPNVP